MTIDISFGKLTTNELGEPWVDWDPTPPKAYDGVSSELCIYAGHPVACFETASFIEWVQNCPEVQAIYIACQPDQPVRLSEILDAIMSIPNAEGLDGERGRWLKYWALRAQEEFGVEAAILRF